MQIVDTHCHIGLHKYEPVETLLFHMARTGVDQAVFIQYMGNSDNGYIVEALRAHPGQFAAAMVVEADDDGSAVRRWTEQGIGGIRLPANARATANDPLIHWRTAAELCLVVSAPSRPETLLSDEFAEVLRLFPNLQIVIEHLAGASRSMEPPYEDFKRVLALAEHENLTIKLPGFGEFCDLTALFQRHQGEEEGQLKRLLRERTPAFFDALPPLAEMVLEAFGPGRTMWGSDWPPVSTREGYDSSLRVPMAWASTLSEAEQALLFGKTAQKVWKLKE